MEATKTPEQVAGERIREIRITRHLTQAALAKAMQALGYNWLQTTVAKTEAAERPLRLNEATDLAGVLGVEVGYLLTSPLTGVAAASEDFREMLRAEEIAGGLDAEVKVLHQELQRKLDARDLALRQAGAARQRLIEAGANLAVTATLTADATVTGPKDTDGEH